MRQRALSQDIIGHAARAGMGFTIGARVRYSSPRVSPKVGNVAKSKSTYNISTRRMTAAERQSAMEYARRVNEYLTGVGGIIVQRTAGALRSQTSSAARRERIRAERAGTPYSGQAGHVPDTAITGLSNPPGGWLDMAGKSNNIAGAGLSSRIGTRINVITIDGRFPR